VQNSTTGDEMIKKIFVDVERNINIIRAPTPLLPISREGVQG
jgi:hypothetical protein